MMKDSLIIIVVLTFILFLSTINTHLSRYWFQVCLRRSRDTWYNGGARTRDTYVTPRPAADRSTALASTVAG